MKSNAWIAGLLFMAVVCSGGNSAAQVQPPIAKPTFHGVLQTIPARGIIDRKTGLASVVVRRWSFIPNPDSNGVFPEREPVLIALGASNFLIPAGMMRMSRNGTVFVYHAAHVRNRRGVQSLRLTHQPDDSFYTVSFRVEGVDVATLNEEDPLCRPLAVIVGDDDGFVSIVLTSPSFHSHRLSLPTTCIDPSASWPWLGR